MTDYSTAEARMRAHTRQVGQASADRLADAEIVERTRRSPADLGAPADQWQREGRIFAIGQDAVDYFPGYGLDPHDSYRPLTAMREVFATFACSPRQEFMGDRYANW
jgi:hypothetical protein